MIIAKNENSDIVDIEDAIINPEKKYYCRECGSLLIVRNGINRCAHFAHKADADCDTFSHDMSEWHYSWQSRFPKKNREVPIPINNPKHRADVLACGYVVEFQHSKLSMEEFEERNEFYTQEGYKIIWIIDCIDEMDKGRLNFDDSYSNSFDDSYSNSIDLAKMYWRKKPNKFDYLDAWNPKKDKNIIVFFQLGNATQKSDEEDEGYLYKVDWVYNDAGMSDFRKAFYTSSKKVYNAKTLIEAIKKMSI